MTSNKDYGLKVSLEGKDISSTNLNDLSLSESSSLMLLEKKTLTFTAKKGQTGQSGAETYDHKLGYAPFTLGFVEYSLYGDTISDILPHVHDSGTPYGSHLYTDIALTITPSQIQLAWSVEQTISGWPEELDNDINFNITLHIYSFKLGS